MSSTKWATRLLLAGLALIMVTTVSAATTGEKVTVQTPDGPLIGLDNGQSRQFKSIPYAEPPVGALRWKAPIQNQPWSSARDATAFSNAGCPQICTLPPHTCPVTISEDCLYLNVYAPSGAPTGSKLPVMLFFPGGRFEQGTADTILYNGQWQANHTGIIQVVTNYRLGALGTLFTGDEAIGGNFNILDQQLALKWVQRSISVFGGDPTRVTIWGQSAGGSSVSSHLVAPGSSGLFHGAIQDSTPMGLAFQTKAVATVTADKFAVALGCQDHTDTACLMAAPVDAVLAAQHKAQTRIDVADLFYTFYPWTPTVGTAVMPQQPLVQMTGGNITNKVPVMMGTVQNEGTMFIDELFTGAKGASWLEFELLVDALFPEHHAEIKALYKPLPIGSDENVPLSHLATDYLFACPARAAARALRQATPTYLYQFDHVLSDGKVVWGANYTFCQTKVCHASELPLVFQITHDQSFVTFTADEVVLAKQMASAWAAFATAADPAANSKQYPLGPAFSLYNGDTLFQWKTPQNQLVTDFKSAQCDLWDKVGYQPLRPINAP